MRLVRKVIPGSVRARAAIAVLAVVAIIGGNAGCSGIDDSEVSMPNDSIGCGFGVSNSDGKGFKTQIDPGTSDSVDDNTKVVEIPVSNRFYNMSETRDRDPGAPRNIPGFDAEDIEVTGQFQLRFQFNASTACDWFGEHGRRNAAPKDGTTYRTEPNSDGQTAACEGVSLDQLDMGFNVRGCMTPWFSYLAENFGAVFKNVAPVQYRDYAWRDLVLNREVDGELAWSQLETTLGDAFTARLNSQLTGADDAFYFCGVATDPNAIDEGDCPIITVEVLGFETLDEGLMEDLRQANNTRERLELANNTAEARAALEQLQPSLTAELQAQADQAALEQMSDPAVAKCVALANAGVDCAALAAAEAGVPWYGGDTSVQVQQPSG